MTVSIGSNISALNTQRRLAESSTALSRTLERLSTGQRINRASDDSAGLAIAAGLNTDQRLYSGALRNLNDGISVINIIDGALDQQSRILQRLAELSEQSANGTFSSSQRDALDGEYKALLKEFNRIAESTSFNGQKLLQGKRDNGLDQILVQAGIDGGIDSVLQLSGADTGSFSGVLDWTDLSQMGSENGTTNSSDNTNFNAKVSTVNNTSDPARNMLDWCITSFKTTMTDSAGTARDAYFAPLEYNWNSSSSFPGLLTFAFYLFDKSTNKILKTTVDNGCYCFGMVAIDPSTGEVADDQKHLNVSVNDIIDADNNVMGLTGTAELDLSALRLAPGEGPSAIDFTGVETVNRAKSALTSVKNRISELASIRGVFGAALSRLETAAQTSASSRENVAQAASRITDADIAGESAALVQTRILQRAAAAVLAQASHAPALALDLLG